MMQCKEYHKKSPNRNARLLHDQSGLGAFLSLNSHLSNSYRIMMKLAFLYSYCLNFTLKIILYAIIKYTENLHFSRKLSESLFTKSEWSRFLIKISKELRT